MINDQRNANMDLTGLEKILAELDSAPIDVSAVTITGADPILPSPFRLGEGAAIALGAMGYFLNELWFLKTNSYQDIHVSVHDAAIAMRSHAYLRVIDGLTPELWDPLSGFYQTSDKRWIQLHCNFLHHRQGVVQFLKCQDERSAVEHAILNYNAIDLETKLSELGLCAAMVRSPKEWQEHPQGQAIAALPLMEVIKMGDSSPQPLPVGTRPLSGIKVLDLTRVIAGPVCGKTLAEQGANVLSISSPHLPFMPSLVMDTGFGKNAAYLDLTEEKDCDTLRKLVQQADIFLESYRPHGLAEKGFSAQDVSTINPHSIYIELTAYSHQGPWARRHGYDSLVQCVTGIVSEQTIGEKPMHLPAQALDYITGYLASVGALVALKRRAREGGSYLVRVSLAQTAHWLQSLPRVKFSAESCKIPTAEMITQLLTISETPFGQLEHMLPVLHLSKTPARWDKPAAPLGTHAAAFD